MYLCNSGLSLWSKGVTVIFFSNTLWNLYTCTCIADSRKLDLIVRKMKLYLKSLCFWFSFTRSSFHCLFCSFLTHILNLFASIYLFFDEISYRKLVFRWKWTNKIIIISLIISFLIITCLPLCFVTILLSGS